MTIDAIFIIAVALAFLLVIAAAAAIFFVVSIALDIRRFRQRKTPRYETKNYD
ncbi:hypothetical protein [Serratia marcescens]|uniref:hypothetical protein n=1 Tax=Serratia marcescens TaxID=615 RepID=UPI00092BE9CB|nr:hypothetical protein [Serratia marcescens]OJH85168.1 hypothetical protein ASJ78_01453 [Serratia marcescens]